MKKLVLAALAALAFVVTVPGNAEAHRWWRHGYGVPYDSYYSHPPVYEYEYNYPSPYYYPPSYYRPYGYAPWGGYGYGPGVSIRIGPGVGW